MPKNDQEYNVNWRKNIVDMITRMQVVDASSKKQTEKNSLQCLGKHYFQENLIGRKYIVRSILRVVSYFGKKP